MELVTKSILIIFMIFLVVTSGNASSYYEPVIVDSSSGMMSNKPKINNVGTIVYRSRDGDGCDIFKMNEKGNVTIIPLASCESSSNYFELNDHNKVIFTNFINKTWDIFLYNTETIAIGNDPDDEQDPQLNNNGQAAWWSGPQPQGNTEYDVYFYENGIVERIHPPGFNYVRNIRINNLGHVVWYARPDGSVRPEILLYSNGMVKNITNTDMVAEWNPEINDHGHIVWHASGGIHLYQNGNVQNIAELFGCDSGGWQKINNAGDVTWIGYHCDKRFDSKVLLYQNGTVKDISGTIPDDYNVEDLSLNNNGQVVWTMRKKGDSKVFLYSDGVTQAVGSNEAYNDNPQINDQGQVVFWSWMPDDTFHVMLASPTSLEYPDYYTPSPISPPTPTSPPTPSAAITGNISGALTILLEKY